MTKDRSKIRIVYHISFVYRFKFTMGKEFLYMHHPFYFANEKVDPPVEINTPRPSLMFDIVDFNYTNDLFMLPYNIDTDTYLQFQIDYPNYNFPFSDIQQIDKSYLIDRNNGFLRNFSLRKSKLIKNKSIDSMLTIPRYSKFNKLGIAVNNFMTTNNIPRDAKIDFDIVFQITKYEVDLLKSKTIKLISDQFNNDTNVTLRDIIEEYCIIPDDKIHSCIVQMTNYIKKSRVKNVNEMFINTFNKYNIFRKNNFELKPPMFMYIDNMFNTGNHVENIMINNKHTSVLSTYINHIKGFTDGTKPYTDQWIEFYKNFYELWFRIYLTNLRYGYLPGSGILSMIAGNFNRNEINPTYIKSKLVNKNQTNLNEGLTEWNNFTIRLSQLNDVNIRQSNHVFTLEMSIYMYFIRSIYFIWFYPDRTQMNESVNFDQSTRLHQFINDNYLNLNSIETGDDIKFYNNFAKSINNYFTTHNYNILFNFNTDIIPKSASTLDNIKTKVPNVHVPKLRGRNRATLVPNLKKDDDKYDDDEEDDEDKPPPKIRYGRIRRSRKKRRIVRSQGRRSRRQRRRRSNRFGRRKQRRSRRKRSRGFGRRKRSKSFRRKK